MSGKHKTRTRATEAFRRWAREGCPDADTIRASIALRRWPREISTDGAYDLLACAVVFALLSEERSRGLWKNGHQKLIRDAVRCVYMEEPWRQLRRTEVTLRVRRFAVENYCTERNVYAMLATARAMWVRARDQGDKSFQ